VRLAGAPGIGKTALLRRAAANHGDHVAFVTAEPASQSDAGSMHRRLVEARAENAELIVIDDVQWLDEQSKSALLRSFTAATPIALLLGDRRPYAPDWPAHETINVPPLRRSAALQLVRRVYPAARPDVAADLADAADGVPLIVVLLAQDAATRSVTNARDANLSIAAVIAARFGRLPPAAQRAARLVALVEAPMPLRVLARALDASLDDAAEMLSELRDVMVVEGNGVAYCHDAFAAAVAKTVPNTVDSYARLLAAYDVESGSLAAIVRCALGCGRNERAAAAALELARTLARAGSLGAALQYAKIALDNAPRSLSTQCVVEYALVLQMLSRDDEAAALLRSAIRAALAASDLTSASDLVAAFFSPAITLERFTELEGLCRRIEETPACPDSIANVLAGVRRWSLAYAGRLDEFSRLDSGQERRRWADARSAAFAYALLGDFERATLELDRYAAGLEHRHARQQTPDDLLESIVGFYFHGTSVLDRLQGSAEGARHPSERAFRALAAVCAGRWNEADDLLGKADEDADEPHQVLEVRLLLAALRRTLAHDSGALRTLRSMIGQRRVRRAVSPARWLLLAKGDGTPADIEGFVRETLDVAPMPDDLSASPFAVAKLSERFGAERCRTAIDVYPVFRTPWHRAHHALAFGLIERSHERLRAARTSFDELNCPALAMIAGLELPVPRARDLALARRLNVRTDAPPATAPLTKRERTIAEYAAAGASNQEIAATLSLSVRTVETHLTKIYAKLGVPSRGAMAALLHREVI
jgi:DNA-binding CsgD family transcriptional regulator/tetratricopeptide (TPR) repeat protein